MRALIVDDEEFVRLVVEQALREEGCDTQTAGGGQEGLDRLRTASFDCVITDLRMPGLDGRAILRWVKEHQPDVDVIVLTGHGDVKDAVAAMKAGAWDFLIKDTPFDGAAVKAALARLRTVRELRRENLAARHGGYRQDAIVEGTSQAWRTVKAQIAQVAPSQAPVLIQGETGSGKDVVARLLHAHSRRAEGPFIAVNCGAVSRELLESELFGYEKGAFTGATQRKLGLVESARGGTLFLDEVGDIPLNLQVKLLRLLETGTYRRVGGLEPLRADFRLVAATHRDLKKMVEQETFRKDLYYRISTFPIYVPSLAERHEDIPLISLALLERISPKKKLKLHPDTIAKLQACSYPGNIRELRNILERASLMTDGDTVMPQELAIEAEASHQKVSVVHQNIIPLEQAEKQYMQWADENCQGDRRMLAKMLGISERTLYRKLKE